MAINVKNTTFPNILDLIAPHSCQNCGHIGSILCNDCKKYIINQPSNVCPKCRQKLSTATHRCRKCKTLPPIYSLGERIGLLDNLIHAYKYNSTRAIGQTFAELLDTVLPNFSPDTIIVPLPTATNHIRERGFDHTLYLAKRLAKIRHYQIAQPIIRNHNTVQVGANRITRIKQVESAYQISPHATINPANTYLLLDDVWTTGASMTTAIKKLRSLGAKNIIVVLLAISPLD